MAVPHRSKPSRVPKAPRVPGRPGASGALGKPPVPSPGASAPGGPAPAGNGPANARVPGNPAAPGRVVQAAPAPAAAASPTAAPPSAAQLQQVREAFYGPDSPESGAGRSTGKGPRVTVTVSYGKRTAKLSLPASLPVAELIPDIAKRLGVLDPTLVYGGYLLLREDETAISSPGTLGEQAIRDGDRLTLQVNALDDQDRVYDDVVEAVADSVSRAHRPWTSANTTLTSLTVSCSLLGVGALSLALAPASVVNAVICGLVAVALLAIGAVLSSRRLDTEALSLTLVAALFAGVCGYHLTAALLRQPGFYGLPALGAGAGLLVAAGCGALSLARRRLHMVIPATIGAVLLVVSTVGVIVPSWTARAWVIAIAAIGLAANGLPWLALSTSRLSVDSPTSESEIFALPKTIDIHQVRRQYQTGSTLLFDLRAAAGALIVFGVPITVSVASPAGIALVLVLFAAMLFDARRIYAQSQMLVTVVFAGLGICVGCAACTVFHPAWTSFIITLFSLGALLCVIDTQVIRRSTIAMTRLADTTNVICIMATLPLAYLALGL
ncbi:type VII secretion integral membrane protein EccD [Bifidobacterium leontopitheci]|uniref:Type VII secretion protein n=1 Tax=Bifidobacterium leontopitheci TaxID=2650774 RepID=A0A6I1GJB2_9BIFI|nr:type VII secretion integral membrane protein EccD [Bifidobacterium leontopitheci]KAB7789716.1 type VII secretion protein [Bifidobacterium leontopitheci]